MTVTPENHSSTNPESIDPRIGAINELLVGGAGRPGDPVRATAAFRELAGQDVGAAAERLAVLAALGVARPSNWAEAMNWLVRAAELGHRRSQGQLAALAGVDKSPGSGANLREFAGRIDLKGLLRPPGLSPVHEQPAIALIEGLATRPMCRWLIERGQARVAPAMVAEYSTGRWVRDPIRTGWRRDSVLPTPTLSWC